MEPNITSPTTAEEWKTLSRGNKTPPAVDHASYYQIPVIINRYEQLRNSRKEEQVAHEPMKSHEMKTIKDDREKMRKKVNKQEENKHRIIVIGDSHARECAAEIKSNLDENFDAQGFVKQGAGLSAIITTAEKYIQHLSKQDVVVVWRGSRDVGKNETKQGINRVKNFVETNKHTNIILMEAPHRHDLIQYSCVNKEV